MWTKMGSVLGVLAIVASMVWYFANQDALAQATAEKTTSIAHQQEIIVEAVKTLRDIHARQETVKEAEAALRAKLCAEGRLKGADCK